MIDVVVIYMNNNDFNLAEVQLYDQGGSLISRDSLAFASYPSGDTAHGGSQCDDGNLATWCSAGARTTTSSSSWGQSSLAILTRGSIAVSRIVIWNRQDCCQDLINGATVVAYSSGAVVWSTVVPSTSAATYSFDVSVPTAQPSFGVEGRQLAIFSWTVV